MPQKCGDKHATSRVSIGVRADRAVAAATGSRRDRGDGFIAGGVPDKKRAALRCSSIDRDRTMIHDTAIAGDSDDADERPRAVTDVRL
ncbi:hypothetical protein K6W16_11660 [Burkholderia dolosa]|uniref:Uncharacterized protein n=1 Tax=Burkholderia dolosa TaxID=152500 RepID=A0A892I675_9BURK|nr:MULTISPECIES: hypothetical protein [Burkholderia]AKE02254.1 hypothetical protein XM57_04380 [Burkholderia cepacia]AYZ96997.1 hypothetical protein EGY28_18100 [Burkholderia dolosa]ETP66723.1 hypothetical protein BDSB_00840 [Burkholderia dolosa PC543]MBR8419195.1 hypothetical protein [Burkholderia dolosa]MBY4657598.1 hypothetical protein [Burkholderia dolosa]